MTRWSGGSTVASDANSEYESVCAAFRWDLPRHFNIAQVCVDRHPRQNLGLIEVENGRVRQYTFGHLSDSSNRLANALAGLGLETQDRVGIVMPQGLGTAIAHLAIYKLRAIAVPLTVLFGPEALRHRLTDSGARFVLAHPSRLEAVEEAVRGTETRIIVDGRAAAPHLSLGRAMEAASSQRSIAATDRDLPAVLIYTSGTTGPPKGALHAHRVLLGHLPGFDLSHDGFPRPGDCLWTPADWAWIGGLMDALLPTWFHGRPVVAAPRTGFEPDWAVRLIGEHGIRNVFLPPTALKIMRQADVRLDSSSLRSAMSGGESLGPTALEWARERLGVSVNEIYGQTEANYVVGNSQALWPVQPGSMGRPYPGHHVAIMDTAGAPVPAGVLGEVTVRAPDPVMFLGYWQNEAATAEKIRDGWLRTGDIARADERGNLWFHSRADDLISSAGYRIGPGEIEECLLQHPAVRLAAVVGVPDELRGEAIKAFIELADGHTPSPTLEEDIQQFVRQRLAAYEYPRQVEIVESIPRTATGKIRRGALKERPTRRSPGAPTVRF
jgi:acetyl-CoA synthetase